MPLSRAAAALLITVAGLTGCVTFDHGEPDLHSAAAAIQSAGAEQAPRATMTADRFTTAEGVALPLRVWLPEGEPQAVVLALHGLNDYSNAFALPAPGLTAQGIAVYAYDQRGFGATPQRGHWAGETAMAEDAILAATLLRERYPNVPLYLLGESMGGAVAVLAATDPASAPVDGVILAAPAVWGRQKMNVFQRVGLWLIGQMPTMQVSQRSMPYRVQASDNIPMLRALGADPLVIKKTRTDMLTGIVDLMSAALARAPRLTVPTLVLYGETDEIMPRSAVAEFIARLPAGARRNQHIALHSKGYHLLLRDLQAATVLADIGAWVHDPIAALPSGADQGARAALTGRGETVALAH
jgi:alpha-beta hydrolase superfamily lysophospholipase